MNQLSAPDRTESDMLSSHVAASRQTVRDVLAGRDDRVLAIVGPCSAHDPAAMREYAEALSWHAKRLADDVFIMVRAYAEKPRTRHGWSGLLLQPGLDDEYRVNDGIALTRAVLSDVNRTGLAVATEFVEPMLAEFVSDLVAWGAIGARTVESPPHRRLASGLDMPVGMKNRVDGAIAPAIDAIAVASRPQAVLGVDDTTGAYWSTSPGNPDAHLVLRGGDAGGNYTAPHVEAALRAASELRADPRIIVDCSHGNSGKDHTRQPLVAADVAEQIGGGQHGLSGVLLESFLHPGAQRIDGQLRYGVSVTDSCLGLPGTVQVLDDLARAARDRRRTRRQMAVMETS